MNKNLKILLDPTEFADDESVDFAAIDKEFIPGSIEEEHWVCISERLWSRLLSFGVAYQLHFPQIIESEIDTILVSEQCQSFIEELEFLMDITNDAAFSQALSVIYEEASKVVNRKNMRFVISPP